jgi:hypothetical protein
MSKSCFALLLAFGHAITFAQSAELMAAWWMLTLRAGFAGSLHAWCRNAEFDCIVFNVKRQGELL